MSDAPFCIEAFKISSSVIASLMLQRSSNSGKTKGYFLVWLARQLATVFGLGYVPKASGTWGTLAAIPMVYGAQKLGHLEFLILVFFGAVVGVVTADLYCKSSSSGDPREVIIDEVVGYFVAMTWLPFNAFYVIGTFLVFRFFDILKPPPVSFFDLKNRGGMGVMADDLVAGILTNLIFQWIFQSGWTPPWT
ncbi:MAG: phosphatidylglycerophosphatase A [Bdellovibrionaceae bacterium]|nr:phosphatidylglycerophosphatase A [Pseudobdellovibrionaceae bacterium]